MNMMLEHENQKLKTRIAELKADNAKLREALEQAADMNDWGASAICRAALEARP